MVFCSYPPNSFEHLEEDTSLGQGGHVAPRKDRSAENLLCALQGWILPLSLLQGPAPAMTLPAILLPPSTPDKGHVAVYSSIFETFLVKFHSTDCPGMLKNGTCLKPREEKY